MTDIEPVNGLKALLEAHAAKKAALLDEARAIAELTTPVTDSPSTGPTTPGNQTSEGKRTFIQSIIGYILTGLTSGLAAYAASNQNQMLATVATVLAGIGAALTGQANASYSRNRADVKSAEAKQ